MVFLVSITFQALTFEHREYKTATNHPMASKYIQVFRLQQATYSNLFISPFKSSAPIQVTAFINLIYIW